MIDVLKLTHKSEINGIVQEKRNSSALAMELHLSCTNPSRYGVSVVSSNLDYVLITENQRVVIMPTALCQLQVVIMTDSQSSKIHTIDNTWLDYACEKYGVFRGFKICLVYSNYSFNVLDIITFMLH